MDDCDRAKYWGWVRLPRGGWQLICYGDDQESIWRLLASQFPVLHEADYLRDCPRPAHYGANKIGVSIVVLPAHEHPAGGRL